MLTRRQTAILRQLVRRPYVYRWLGLVTAVGLWAGVAALVLSDTVLPRTGPPALADAGSGGTPGVELVVGPVRAATPALLSDTAAGTADGTRRVALTLDDGPDPATTPQVLDLLARHHAVATFCMIGDRARAHPDLVRRVVAAGHRLCDHTMTHDPDVGAHAPDVLAAQVRASHDNLVAAGGGAPVTSFRAPEGRWTPALEQAVAAQGMQPLGWSVDTRDWARPGVPAIVDAVHREVHPGAVILVHDGGGPREQTVAALREILPWLGDQGYAIVPAD